MAEFIAESTTFDPISTHYHVKITSFLTLKLNRFSGKMVRYSNIAPRFQCKVIRKPFVYRGFSALYLTDARPYACVRARMRSRSRNAPNPLSHFGRIST